MTIKIFPADRYFSLCVRERSENTCERCGTVYKDRPGLQCCHFESRRNYAIRFEPLNAFALCYGCHQLMDGSRIGFTQFYLEKRGKQKLDILIELSRDLMRGKQNRKDKKEIADFYQDEYLSMLVHRAEGLTGWLEFAGWN